MWSIIGIILIGVLVSLKEVPSLLKQKHYKDMFVFSTVLLTGMTCAILLSIGISIPNPLNAIAKIYAPVSNLLDKILT